MYCESSKSSMESSQTSSISSELVRIGGGQLFLLDRLESVPIGLGDFSLILMLQANSPLATLVGQVAELQWPMGKDGPVLKIGHLRYTFAIPGLFYGLILPDDTSEENVQTLERYMREFCTFEIRPEIARAAGVSNLRLWSSIGKSVDTAEEGARYWTAVAENVEGLSMRLVQQMNHGSTPAAKAIVNGGEVASSGIRLGGSYVTSNTNPRKGEGGEMSPRMRKRVDQARRMSAVAKLLSRTVLRGAVSATGHVANFMGTPPLCAFMSNNSTRDVAVASVDAFAKVVEAVESAGKSLMTTSSVESENAQQASQEGMGAMGTVIKSMWTLNKVGLRMLWQATAASTALSISRSRTTSNSSSSNSEESVQNSSPMNITGSTPPSGNSLSPQCSSGGIPSSPLQHEEGLRTAQLFPTSSTAEAATSTFSSQVQHYAIPAPSLYTHPGYPPSYHPPPAPLPRNPNKPFQQYRRPSGPPPQVQPFFPHPGLDRSKSQ